MKLFLQIILMIVAVVLIAIITLQPSKGEGLGAIGSGGQMFFSKNKGFEKLLDRVTTTLSILFAVILILVEVIAKI